MVRYFPLPPINSDFLSKSDTFILFETVKCDKENYKSYLFLDPVELINIQKYDDINIAFNKIEKLSKKYFLAGLFSYELGYLLDNHHIKNIITDFPLICMGVFKKAVIFDHKKGKFSENIPHSLIKKTSPSRQSYSVRNLDLDTTKAAFNKKIQNIKKEIRCGNTYQVNLTGKLLFDFSGNEFSFYNDLKISQQTSYSSFMKIGGNTILSISPELFFKRNKNNIYLRPMKGTVKRGRTNLEDEDILNSFLLNKKEKAENLMIVDLIRNDLGRICRTSSVKVKDIFRTEKYNSLFQMTSTISGVLKNKISYYDIFKSLFPSGSVTGAPKINTMKIIKRLEKKNRELYCGALGFITPKLESAFNIPIRTVSIKASKGCMGIGSGVVWDSKMEKEFEEWALKKNFLSNITPDFQLIETILWNKRYWLLNKHLKRLKNSCFYFQFQFFRNDILKELNKLEKSFKKSLKYKVRLLMNRNGNFNITTSILKKATFNEPKIAISNIQTDATDVFLYHKTTMRNLYNDEYNEYRSKGYLDVLFFNKHGFLTEGATSNVFLIKNGKWFTPSITSGILNGTCREHIIQKRKVEEKKLKLKDLLTCDEIVITNSVRGIIRNVRLIQKISYTK